MTRLQEIQDRLKAATPGPWEWGTLITETAGGWRVYTGLEASRGNRPIVLEAHDHVIEVLPGDADLIANAPTDIAFLLVLLDEATKVLRHYASMRFDHHRDCWKATGPYAASDFLAKLKQIEGQK